MSTETFVKKSPTTDADNKRVDADGEVIDISGLNLIAMQSDATDIPEFTGPALQSIAKGVAQAATYEKRTLPFHKKSTFYTNYFFSCSLIGHPKLQIAQQIINQLQAVHGTTVKTNSNG